MKAAELERAHDPFINTADNSIMKLILTLYDHLSYIYIYAHYVYRELNKQIFAYVKRV